jgi:hypothetical protein
MLLISPHKVRVQRIPTHGNVRVMGHHLRSEQGGIVHCIGYQSENRYGDHTSAQGHRKFSHVLRLVQN